MSGAHYCCPWDGCPSAATFIDCRSLLRHLYLMHGYSERGHLYCGIEGCQDICSTTDSFRKHIYRRHSEIINVEEQQKHTARHDAVQASSSDTAVEAMEEADLSGNIDEMMTQFSRRLLLFALRIREQFILPKSTFQSIMSDVHDIVTCYHGFVSDIIAQAGIDLESASDDLHFLNDSSLLNSVWNAIDTDTKLRKNCSSLLNLVEPEEVLLGTNAQTGQKETYQYVPLIKTLKNYLEHEDVWESINAVSVKADDVLRDYSDGNNFKVHEHFSLKPNSIRLHFYVDDFEVCNPLGSARSKHKLTAVYYYVGNVEKQYTSSLRCIHVAILARSNLVKKYSYQSVFERLITDLQIMETEGIVIDVNGEQTQVFASLATISADNLASHQLGGFRMSFSSGRICRNCMVSYDNISRYFSEGDHQFPVIRSPAVLATHVQSVLVDGTLASVYGISGECALKRLTSFNSVTCLPPDCMHDLLEGVVPLTLMAVLRGLIAQGIITVSIVNDRLLHLTLAASDRSNAPPLLPQHFPSKSLLGTASQMWTLLRILPFVIGDLVNEFTDVWELYILLRQICDIVFAPAVHKSWLSILDQFISDHNRLLVNLCQVRLTPKCHFLVHYPRLIADFGPLRYLWCMRFEGYHRYLKAVACSLGNFKNIAKTLADRNQMKKCYEQAGSCCLEPPSEFCEIKNELTVAALPACIQTDITSFYGCCASHTVLSVTSLQNRGVQYSVGDYFVIDIVDDDIPLFVRIKHLLSREGVWCIVGRLHVSGAYLRHYHAYSVRDVGEWVFSRVGLEKDFHAYQPYSVFLNGREHKLITLRHKLLPMYP